MTNQTVETKETNETEQEVPQHALQTAKQLFRRLSKQRIRLTIVAVSILLYTALNVFIPYYSTGVVDDLFSAIKNSVETGSVFSIS